VILRTTVYASCRNPLRRVLSQAVCVLDLSRRRREIERCTRSLLVLSNRASVVLQARRVIRLGLPSKGGVRVYVSPAVA